MLTADLVQAARCVLRRPALLMAVVLTLGLGVFGTSALARAVLETAFEPPPGTAIDDVYAITTLDRTGRPTYRRSIAGLTDLQRQRPDVVAAVAIDAGTWQATLERDDREGQFTLGFVDGQYATALGLGLQAGRWIDPNDNRSATGVVVIGDGLTTEWFRGRPDAAIGALVTINGRPFTVIGVADPDFGGLTPGVTVPAAWVPVTTGRSLSSDAPDAALGLVKPRAGVSVRQFEAAIQSAMQGTGIVSPSGSVSLTPLAVALRDGAAVNKALLLTAMAIVLWLTSCASVLNLLFARAAERRTEIAVRVSLGATPGAIVRLLSAEALIVATIAAVSGLLIMSAAWWLLEWQAPGLAGVGDASWGPWLFWLLPSIAITFASTVVVAAVTARLLTRGTPPELLASGNRSVAGSTAVSRVRTVLVAFQVAVALQAALGAGLYAERLSQIRRQAPAPTADAFDAHLLTTARVDLGVAGYDEARANSFVRNLLTDLMKLPGVEAAAVANELPSSEPGRSYISLRDVDASGAVGSARATFAHLFVTPGFFDTLGIPIREGTSLPASAAPVAVISESGARALWPGQPAVGRRLAVPRPDFERKRIDYEQLTVVGVAADPVRRSATSPMWAGQVIFVPLNGSQAKVIITRSTDPAAQVDPIRRTVRALDPVVALAAASAREDREQMRLAALGRVDAAMVAVSILAVLLSAVGVYGLMAFFASARAGELAVRVALGASPASIRAMLIRQAVRIVLFGLLPGVLAASVLSRALQAQVLDFMPNDLGTWSAAIVIVLGSGVAASCLPARRAARENPATRLQSL